MNYYMIMIVRHYRWIINYLVSKTKKENININDKFFDELKNDYKEFNTWFKKIEDRQIYTSYENNNLIALLILKIEEKEKDFIDIEPRLDTKKRIKVSTFKVDIERKGIGTKFLEIIENYAKENNTNEIYLTLYDNNIRKSKLIRFLIKNNYKFYGKKKKEKVFIKKMWYNIIGDRMKKLENKVAIVTGGAMGNGLGIVKVFLKYGAKVIILDYSEKLNEVVENFQKDGHEVSGYRVDIRNKGAINTSIQSVIKQYGNIDILVNNAGVCKLERFEDMDDELRDFHFDINIKGSWNVTKACLPYMKNRKAAIVNLSSVTGPMVADPGEVAYAATKGANLGFTKALARELVDYDIRVNAIMPGYIRTPLIDTMAVETCPEDPESVVNSIASAIPMGRMGTIEEVGELAAFLACEESSYITGQGIVIDGASTLPETATMGV